MEKNRYQIVDIVKAIGIISIIIGHTLTVLPLTGLKLGSFVYLFHITIFFFVIGFCYNIKYTENQAMFIGKRIIRILIPFLIYNTVFVFLHNLLVNINLIDDGPYSKADIAKNIVNGLILETNESMLGAFWFLPVLVIACIIFSLSFQFSNKLSNKFNRNIFVLHTTMIIIMTSIAFLGFYFHDHELNLRFHMQTAFLCAPVIYIGFIVKIMYPKIKEYLGLMTFLIAIISLKLFLDHGYNIELAYNQYASKYLFYPISIIGIIFCLSLGHLLLKLKYVKDVLIFIGRNSFHYMALHFIVIKIIDLVVWNIKKDSIDVLRLFPKSYDLGLLYVIITVLVITLSIVVAKLLKKKFNRFYIKLKKDYES